MDNTSEAKQSPYVSDSPQKAMISTIETLGGKLTPQANDLEEAVLGALMIDKNAVAAVIDILKPQSFYHQHHHDIFKAMQALFHKSEPIDLLTVAEELRKADKLEEVGGAFYITDLTNKVASAANVETHARIISQKFLQRELIRISTEITTIAYEDSTDVFELLDEAERKLFEVSEGNLRRNTENITPLLSRAIDQIEALKDREEGLTGIPAGFTELDRVTSGWQNSDLVIIAARPGMGKTAFTLSLARNAAVDHGQAVAFFSLEMSSVQLVKRLISCETEIPADKLRNGNLQPYEWEQLHAKIKGLDDAPIFIDDTPALNIFELRAKCRRLKAQHDIKLIVIDYLQLMGSVGDNRNKNREQEISNISRSLKSIAKELDVPVIALSQLSRATETRGGDKRPMLSDLRESGAIEQDADMVIFLYRPEYYGITEDENGNSLNGIAEVIISKHRNGALKNVYTRFIDKFPKFVDMEVGDFDFEGGLSDDNHSQTRNVIRGSKMNNGGASSDPSPF